MSSQTMTAASLEALDTYKKVLSVSRGNARDIQVLGDQTLAVAQVYATLAVAAATTEAARGSN
jgi:hypothetical protein